MKRALIYPYTNKLDEMIVYAIKNRRDISIDYLVHKATTDSVHDGDSFADGQIDITGDFMGALEKADTAVILNADNSTFHEDLISKIQMALEKGRQVECYARLQAGDLCIFESCIKNHQLRFFNNISDNGSKKCMHQLECIVVGIGKMLNDLNSLPALMKLEESYSNKGYKVAAVSSEPNAAFMGYHYLSDEYFENNEKSIPDRIIDLNAYLVEIEKAEKPDILLIQFPDGMIKHSDFEVESFGIYSYMLSAAVNVDYFVLSVPYTEQSDYDDKRLAVITDFFKYRYGFAVDALIISNKTVDDFCSIKRGKIVMQNIDIEAESSFEGLKSATAGRIPIYSGYDSNIFEKIADDSEEYISSQMEEF